MTDLDLLKRQIETQLAEYEAEIAKYAAFWADWRERNDPSAMRVRRFREAAKRGSAA